MSATSVYQWPTPGVARAFAAFLLRLPIDAETKRPAIPAGRLSVLFCWQLYAQAPFGNIRLPAGQPDVCGRVVGLAALTLAWFAALIFA
jgi:hypothetical protein